MNIELTVGGTKTIFNWDNVFTAGYASKSSSSYGSEKRVQIWFEGNVVWHIDETYEEMKDILKQRRVSQCLPS